MNYLSQKTLFVLALMAVWPAAQAANISKADYDAGKSRIESQYKTDKAACDSMSGNAKDICQEEAKGKQKTARAELEFSHSGKASDQKKVATTRAETAYAVAKEKCDDKAGNYKDVCVKEAKAAKEKALADAKSSEKISAAKTDAAADKRDADYKVAVEKCDALAGDAKTTCVNDAKGKFGK